MREQILERVRARPFLPFSIELTGGRRVEVPHSDHILIRGKGLVAVQDDRGLVDVFSTLYVASLTYLDPAEA